MIGNQKKKKKNVEKEHLNYTHRKQELIMVLFLRAMNIHIISIMVCFCFRNDFVETDFLVVIVVVAAVIFFPFNLRFGFYYLEIHHIPFGFSLIIIFCIAHCVPSFLQYYNLCNFSCFRLENPTILIFFLQISDFFSDFFPFLFHRYDLSYYLLIVF